MNKSCLFYWPLLAASMSLSLFACQPTQAPTGSKPLTQTSNLLDPHNTQPTQQAFRIQDWVTDTGRYRGVDGLSSLNIQLDFQNTTARSPNSVSVDMGTPAVPDRPEYQPTYNIFFSDYILDANAHQVPTRGFLIYSDYMLQPVSGQDTSFSTGMNFIAYMESTDGIHFNFVQGSQGQLHYQYGAPDSVLHGNIGSCQFGEVGDLAFDFDYTQSTLSLDSDNKTFTTNLIITNGAGTKSHGLSPWQCSYQCSPQNGGAYNEQCSGTVHVGGNIAMEGHLNFTEPTQLVLQPTPNIFSTNRDVNGGTSFYAGNLPWDQLWRITLPDYNGQPLVIQQAGSSGGFVTGWSGEKYGSPWAPYGQFTPQTFYQDGTYPVTMDSDHGQHLNTTVRIDSTAPKIDEPVLKVLQDGRRQVLITVKDPLVNGVRAGLDASQFKNGFISVDGRNTSIKYKQIDENTVQVIAEYLPNPKPTPTPSARPSSGPSSYPSGIPSYDPSSNPTPVPTPTPWQDPDLSFEDELTFQIGFDAYDKVYNHTPYAMDFNPPNLKLILDYPYFSPNNDGIKDDVSFHVVDEDPTEDWTLQIKGNGAGVVKTLTGHGSKDLIWDGKNESGQVQPKGKYNLILTGKKQNGWRRSQSIKSVWLELTPPAIILSSMKIHSDRTIELKGHVTGASPYFDYNSLTPDYKNDLTVSGSSVIHNGNAFTIISRNLNFTQSYIGRFISGDTTVTAKVFSCFDGCVKSNDKSDNPEGEGEVDSAVEDPGSFTIASANQAGGFSILSQPYNGDPFAFKSAWGWYVMSFGPKSTQYELKLIARYPHPYGEPILDFQNGLQKLTLTSKQTNQEVFSKRFEGTHHSNSALEFVPAAPGQKAWVIAKYNWNGRGNDGNYLPNGDYILQGNGYIELMDGLLVPGKPQGKDRFSYITCLNDTLKRRAESELIKPNGQPGNGKHGPAWTDADAFARANKRFASAPLGQPQGRFGSVAEVQEAMKLAEYVCPGASYWFPLPQPSHSLVFFPDMSSIRPATHVWVQVDAQPDLQGNYIVHAYPGINPER